MVPVSGRSSAEGPDHPSSVGQCSLFDRMERQNGLISFLFFPQEFYSPDTWNNGGDFTRRLQKYTSTDYQCIQCKSPISSPTFTPTPILSPEAPQTGADSGRKGAIVLGYVVLCLVSCLLSLAPSFFIWIRGREGILPVHRSPLSPATLTHIVSGSQ